MVIVAWAAVGLCAFTAEHPGSIPGWETIAQEVQHSYKKVKKKKKKKKKRKKMGDIYSYNFVICNDKYIFSNDVCC